MCVPQPEMLLHYLDLILDNIVHSSPSVRTAAYACLTRLLRHSPASWSAVLPSYLAALEVQFTRNLKIFPNENFLANQREMVRN